jgi:hypothetical protein
MWRFVEQSDGQLVTLNECIDKRSEIRLLGARVYYCLTTTDYGARIESVDARTAFNHHLGKLDRRSAEVKLGRIAASGPALQQCSRRSPILRTVEVASGKNDRAAVS